MINLGCHSDNFGVFPPDETFAFISRLGFRYIDVAARHLMPQESILAQPGKQALFLKELADRHRVKLDELFLDAIEVDGVKVNPSAGDEAANEKACRKFEVICDFAGQAGFQSVMAAPGAEIAALGYEQSFENAVKTHGNMIKIATGKGLAYHVEPSRNSLMNTPAKALKMVGAVPELRYTLDFLHYQINAIPQHESMELIPYAGHLHARQAATGIGKCPFEQGEIDYDAIVQRLQALNWQGSIAMEFWNDPARIAMGLNPVEQNIMMKYELKCLIKKYCGYTPE